MRLSSTTAVLAATLSLCAASTAQVTEYMTNGDFETGDFTGWVVSGAMAINDGTLPIPGSGLTQPALGGSFDALTNGFGPGMQSLQQCFFVPNTVVSATLAWTDEIRNFAATFSDPNQEFRVVIRDAVTQAQIGAEIFSTNPGDVLIQPATPRSFDISAALQAIPGQAICISIEEEDNLFFQNVSIDDVSLLIDSPDTPRFLIESSVTVNGPACVPGPGTNSSTLFTPDGAGGYNTTPNGGVIDTNFTSGTPLAFTDDSTNVLAIGFAFTMPNGVSLTDIEVDSNARAFEPGLEGTDFSESVAEFLNDGSAQLAPYWDDFNPSAGGQIWQSVGPGGEFVVTWESVPEFGTTNANTFQMVLAADSSITFNYIDIVSTDGIVGVSSGSGALDPGSMDLSAGPIATAGGMVLYEEFTGNNDLGTAQQLPDLSNLSNPVIGTNFDLVINNAAGSIGDFYLLGNPSVFDLSPIGIPCSLETDGILATISTAPGAGYTLNVPNLPALSGQSLNTQGAILDPTAGNPFFVLFTNSIDFTFGDF
ncbi:MAG: nidogen-like domain-containing protein [Planctomycetota bacterium]